MRYKLLSALLIIAVLLSFMWTNDYQSRPEFQVPAIFNPSTIRTMPDSHKDIALAKLVELLNSDDVLTQQRAATTLRALGDGRGVPVMIKVYHAATDAHDRAAALVMLKDAHDPRATRTFFAALSDESPGIRNFALIILTENKEQGAVPYIITHLKDMRFKNKDMVECLPAIPNQTACYALGKLGDPQAIPVLIEVLDDPRIRQSAMDALTNITGQKFGYDTVKWKAWFKDQTL